MSYSAILRAINTWDEQVAPKIYKLKFLKEVIATSGIFSDGWSPKVGQELSRGLDVIFEETIADLEWFYEAMNESHQMEKGNSQQEEEAPGEK